MLGDWEVEVVILVAVGFTIQFQVKDDDGIFTVEFVGINVVGPHATIGIVNITLGLLNKTNAPVVSWKHPSVEIVLNRIVNVLSAFD